MAIKIACVHCGFIFEDEDMEVCPVCGTELGKEWNPAELQSFVVTELSTSQAEVVGKLLHKSGRDVSKELTAEGCFGLNDLTPVQVEVWGNQLKEAGIEFSVENSEQKTLRIQKTLEARTAEAEASKAASAASTEKARLEAEQKKAALASEEAVKKAEAEAKIKANAARLAEEERLKKAAQADADAKAAAKAELLAKQKAESEAAAEAERNREIVCHSCGNSYKHTKKFCPECGAPNKELNPDKWVCTKCGREFTEPAKFCEECGGRIEVVTVENPELAVKQTIPESKVEAEPIKKEISETTSDTIDFSWNGELTIKKQHGLWEILAGETPLAYYDSDQMTVFSDATCKNKICYASKQRGNYQFFDGVTNKSLGTYEKNTCYATANGQLGKPSLDLLKTLKKSFGATPLTGINMLLGGSAVKTIKFNDIAAFCWSEKRFFAYSSYSLIILDKSLVRPAVAAMIILL